MMGLAVDPHHALSIVTANWDTTHKMGRCREVEQTISKGRLWDAIRPLGKSPDDLIPNRNLLWDRMIGIGLQYQSLEEKGKEIASRSDMRQVVLSLHDQKYRRKP